MAKTKILVLIKANPSPFAKEVLQYQEELIRENIDLSKVTLCGSYRFIGKELNFNSFKESCIIPSDISVCSDFECFCNHYDVDLVELSSLFQIMNEIIRISR